MRTKYRPSRLSRVARTALAFSLLLAASPSWADHTTPPILPLQGPGVVGQLLVPVFALGTEVSHLGSDRLTGPRRSRARAGSCWGSLVSRSRS